MQYFVRTMEKHKESPLDFGPELPCSALIEAKDMAKRQVMESDPSRMLQADACVRRGTLVWTKYRCWIDERGDFHERALI